MNYNSIIRGVVVGIVVSADFFVKTLESMIVNGMCFQVLGTTH